MKLILTCVMLLVLVSCGSTHLVTNNANVDIFVNNQFKGKGQTTITRTGPPQKIHIDAKYNGRQVGAMNLRREVDFVTILTGLYTYGIGFFFTWRYPETVIIPIDDIREKKSFDSRESIWNLPPGEWRKK